jgi:hypothetical protein
MSQPGDRAEWSPAFEWSCVFAANLFVPLPLGLLITADGGWVGMIAAVLVCWVAGLVLCMRPGRLGRVLIVGGSLVACAQMFLIPHIVVGMLALWVCHSIAEAAQFPRTGLWAEVGGFAATLLTAQPLLLAALWLGGVRRLFSEPPAGAESPDYAEPTRDQTLTPPDAAWPFGTS